MEEIDHGLDWEPGSAERVLNGGEPTEMPLTPQQREPLSRVDALELIARRIPRTPETEETLVQLAMLPDLEFWPAIAHLLLEPEGDLSNEEWRSRDAERGSGHSPK